MELFYFNVCAPRKGTTGDGAIFMVVLELDARAVAVVEVGGL